MQKRVGRARRGWGQTRLVTIVLVVALAIGAVAAPTVAAIVLAHRAAVSDVYDRAGTYASQVLQRDDNMADEQLAAFDQLKAAGDRFGACSPESRAAMRRLQLEDAYVQAVGHVEGDTIVCSSIGDNHIPLGPVRVTGRLGVKDRYDVTLPGAPDVSFTVVELYGYAMVLTVQDVVTVPHTRDVALGIYSMVNGAVFSSAGHIDPRWTTLELAPGTRRTFRSHGQVVSVATGKKWLTGAVASVSAAGIGKRTDQVAAIFGPIGLLLGAVLAAAIIYLARLQHAIPSMLRRAFRRREFYVEYQPTIELRTGRWCGAEVLVRWLRNGEELVRPDVFLPLIEEHGFGAQLTTRVVELIRDDARELFQAVPGFHLAVNLTPDDLHNSDTVELVNRFLADTSARPGNLAVEATERDLLDPERAGPIVAALRQAGVTVLVDDFGTGYSSLAYLESFDFDGIKIDKTFVDTIGTDAATSHVAFQIVRMGTELGYQLTAEGVEHPGQADRLVQAGVRYGQGWLWAKSMPYSQLVEGLNQNARSLI